MKLAGWLGGFLTGRRSAVPRRIIVRDCAYAMDGGSIHLLAQDERGRQFDILLGQHAFPKANRSTDLIPGRLYFGSQLVPIRSELESQKAEVKAPPSQPQPSGQVAYGSEDIRQFFMRTPEENCRAFLRKIVEFVQSERYISFASEVSRVE
jgi:hypothetical protein